MCPLPFLSISALGNVVDGTMAWITYLDSNQMTHDSSDLPIAQIASRVAATKSLKVGYRAARSLRSRGRLLTEALAMGIAGTRNELANVVSKPLPVISREIAAAEVPIAIWEYMEADGRLTTDHCPAIIKLKREYGWERVQAAIVELQRARQIKGIRARHDALVSVLRKPGLFDNVEAPEIAGIPSTASLVERTENTLTWQFADEASMDDFLRRLKARGVDICEDENAGG